MQRHRFHFNDFLGGFFRFASVLGKALGRMYVQQRSGQFLPSLARFNSLVVTLNKILLQFHLRWYHLTAYQMPTYWRWLASRMHVYTHITSPCTFFHVTNKELKEDRDSTLWKSTSQPNVSQIIMRMENRIFRISNALHSCTRILNARRNTPNLAKNKNKIVITMYNNSRVSRHTIARMLWEIRVIPRNQECCLASLR
jgi:hypothetical protein